MIEINAKIKLANGDNKSLSDIIKVGNVEDVLVYDYDKNKYHPEKFKIEKAFENTIKLGSYYLLTHNSNDTSQNNVNSSIYVSEDQIIKVKIGDSNYNYTKVKDLYSFLKTYDDNDDEVNVFINIFKPFDKDEDCRPLDYIAKYTEDKVFLVNKQKTNTFGLYKYENSEVKEFLNISKSDNVISYVVNGVLI